MQHSTLIGEMAKKKITIEQIAKLLNIHRNSVANKLGGSTAFTIEEAIQIQETFFPDCSLKELFRKEG
ncbi:XRE family transcriptional regulator [Zhenpiania hominis]|uniref:XRE family transcriptional regulator n=1 Tax=Zhenpiania hominis TaxID=2763644 RepID=A0A923NMH2_9FIRM|nr:XRE family transcriptional regulator [Zhenpiania hominis]MBC6678758.1 XRE family transcriptional regulator [Zhenpiania hominis]